MKFITRSFTNLLVRTSVAAQVLFFALLLPNCTAAEAESAPVTFERDVMAVLSKAGCNAGTCHGNLNGKGGFYLSLRGQDPIFDYQQIVQSADGRRINQIDADNSLALLKATAQVPHQGGKRFSQDSPEYRILRDWIHFGVPEFNAEAAKVVALEVTPSDTVLWEPDQQQQLNVIAKFSDDSTLDVTRLAVYEPSDPLVNVSAEGVVKFTQPGIVSVLVRYLEAQKTVRLASRPQQENFTWTAPDAVNFIDEYVFARLQQLKINPAPIAADNIFVRRIYLDLLGILPSAEEAQEFITDGSPIKREKLIDELLVRPEFAERWAQKWSDVLRNEEKTLDAKGVEKLHAWMKDSFAADKPINQFVIELITSRGSTYQNPPANFWRAHREPFVRAETIAQVFLGVRLQCAKCHNHPFDRWSQDEYYEWASLFTGIDYELKDNKRKDKLDKHEFIGEQIVQVKNEGSVKNARTGEPAPPKFLGAETNLQGDRLEQLAAWMTSADNSMFAKAQANRIWYHVMGLGLVEPVDDLRLTNPASHPQLLEQLSQEFIDSGFSLKQLVKTIVMSKTYQLSSDESVTNAISRPIANELYSKAIIRRLSAEQILDAQSQVIGIPAEFKGYPNGTRAGQIAGVERVRRDLGEGDSFLRLFGKPERLIACDCERSDDATLGQALSLVGGSSLNQRIRQADNRIGRLMSELDSTERVVEELYWTALTRPPTQIEMNRVKHFIDEGEDRRIVLEDLTWALVNAKEMLFRN